MCDDNMFLYCTTAISLAKWVNISCFIVQLLSLWGIDDIVLWMPNSVITLTKWLFMFCQRHLQTLIYSDSDSYWTSPNWQLQSTISRTVSASVSTIVWPQHKTEPCFSWLKSYFIRVHAYWHILCEGMLTILGICQWISSVA